MENPYVKLPGKAFWRSAVADKHYLEIEKLWTPKFPILKPEKIATFGSCFAQHFGNALRHRGFNWHDGEPAPESLSPSNIKAFNYQQFSCRTANIYTTSLLNQWVSWALNISKPPEIYWEADGRIYDPFRPRIEPNGFESIDEMLQSRKVTVAALGRVIRTTDLFVFTLGLTESWFDVDGGFEYPMCPGTAGGVFDERDHRFVAQGYSFVEKNLRTVVSLLREANPNIKILLTVSPVPLTATNSGKHVLVATSASKAILRSVAETMATDYAYIDYFPSYEIINSPVFKGAFFKPNQRQVEQRGVNFVMQSFFAGLGLKTEGLPAKEVISPKKPSDEQAQTLADIACEEEILASFATIKDTK